MASVGYTAKQIDEEIGQLLKDVSEPFKSAFKPEEMRCLALVAHNHMKPPMMEFIETHAEILKKFRITGTNTTMKMCKQVFGDDPNVKYGPTCTSGPLGGDAQLAALMCLEDIGGIIFFMDPLSAHPHQADIESLVRMANVHNILLCPNPTSAISTMHVLKQALVRGKAAMVPSFFETLESPAVDDYRKGQANTLASVMMANEEKKITEPVLTKKEETNVPGTSLLLF